MAKSYVLSPNGVKFTEKQEGVVLYVYDDAKYPTKKWKPGTKVSGHLTAGIGHLLSPAEIEQWAGKDIPKAQVDRWFDADNNDAEAAVSSLVKVPLKSNQADVLIDFVFNNNRAAFAKSTLLKRVNAGQFDLVPAELLRWNKTKIDGKLVVSPGLQKRCADRAAYWNSPGMEIAPHIDNKPNGSPIGLPTPKHTSVMEIGSLVVGAISGLGGFASATGFLGVAFGIAILVAVGVGTFIILRRQMAPK